MNWVDLVVLLLVIGGAAYGAKRGLIREVMSVLGIVVGIVLAIHHHDAVAMTFLSKMKASPLFVSFLSFLIVLGVSYLGFKILGFALARAASVNQLGNADKVGGAIVGATKAWIIVGFIFLLLFYLPLPDSMLKAVDSSFIAPAMLGTMPVLYEGTKMFHPSGANFLAKLKAPLTRASNKKAEQIQGGMLLPGDWQNDRTEKCLERLDAHFAVKPQQ